jgi:hypothetical protein
MLTKLLVKAILRSPFDLKWSVQGLGMLRTYLSDEVRLHIWDRSLRVPNVSPIHDHPWHLDSYIVAGCLKQYRFVLVGAQEAGNEILMMSKIKCGEQAHTKTEPVQVYADRMPIEVYVPGESYRQTKDEIHETQADDGTVTLVTRTFTEDRETARVFWRGNGGWVDAAPRPATSEEISRVCKRALQEF